MANETNDIEREMQRNVIGCILFNRTEAINHCVSAGVESSWFSDDRMRLVFDAAVSLWRNQAHDAELDASLIYSEARRLLVVDDQGKRYHDCGIDYQTFEQCLEASGVRACLPAYITQLRGFAIVREMREAVGEAMQDKGEAPEDNVADLVGRLDKILAKATVSREIDFRGLVERSVERMSEAHRIRFDEGRADYVPGIRTPWWQLTSGLNGLLPGLHLIGARTSVGKTSFALQLVRYFAESGLHVGFDSLDMSSGSFVDRFIAEASRVSLYKANFGYSNSRDLESIRRASKSIAKWDIKILVEYDVDSLFNWCRINKRSGKLDILFVDFVQLLSYKGSDRATDTGRMTRVSKTLKRIVNELELPVIGLSQLNRDCERDGGREPTKADLRESGALEQDATTVWLLYHDKDVLAKFKEQARARSGLAVRLAGGDIYMADKITPTWLKIDKNQNGPLCRLPFVVYSNYFAWMLGDFEAMPIVTESKGAVKIRNVDNINLFSRVHADWRHDAFEERLSEQGVLLPEDLPPENKPANETVSETVSDTAFAQEPAPDDVITDDDLNF